MKKLYILLLLPFLALGQSQNQNYIKTTTYKVETASSISNPQPNQATVQVDYFDGTGRLIQQRAIKQAHGDGDIVTHVGYDNVGRPTKSYMPYVETSSSLLYNPNALQETLSFYNTPTYENTTNPYSEQQMEASPLGRVLKQGSPGEHWMVDFPSSTTDHTVKFEYQSNAASEVRLFRVTNTKNSTTKVYDIALVNSGFYGAGQLTKTIVKDENWIATSGNNHTTQEFRNKQGLVLLKRTFENSLARDTYYVYDDFGNLTYVIPPGVNTASSITTTILNDMCYQYKYDFKNRLVEKKLPGKDWEFIVYDKLDRPVLSGPVLTPFGGTQRGWMVSKFDAFGRVAYTAWVSESTFTSARRNTLQNTKDLAAEPIFETKLTSATTNNGVSIQYSNTVFPKTTYTILSINYYDNYTYPGAPAIPPTVEGQPVLTNAKGLSTGTWTRVLNASSVVGELSYVIYDYKARPVRTYQSNYLGGFSQTDSYMEDGLLLYTITSHKRTSQDNVIAVQENFEYTAQGRLVKHLHKLPNKVQERLSNNHYNPMGQLIAKNVGGTNIIESSGLQKVDYRYNIRGWLLEINDTQDLSSGGGLFNDLFSFKINYNTVDNSLNNTVKALYNGNIAEIYWRTASDNVLRKYGYSYDQMNRLLSAVYQKPGATFEVTNSYNETLSYDANGNISTLTRTGEFDDQLHNLQIDNLAYFYHPTRKNQLMKVTDYQNNPNGFKDDSDGTNDTVDDYSYDGFGNMISDQNKNISIIRYNHLNLPTLVDFGVAGKIEYLYNAAGVKVQKKVTAGTLITITDYLNGFQYLKTGSNPVELEFFPHAEGYVKVTDGNVYNYVYNYTDHLGNVRLSYTKDPANNVLTILEENNYYPFGLKHRNYNMSQKQYSKLMSGGGIIITPTNQTVYDYKYNGKEWQDELGLNMYDYGARNYDPALGKWFGIDNSAEKYYRYSPYHYAGNNPVKNIDIDGNEFTQDAWVYINRLIEDINRRQTSNNQEIADYQAQIDAGGNERQIARWKKAISKLVSNNVELEVVRWEIVVLGISKQVYDVVSGGNSNIDMFGNRVHTNSFGFNFNNGRAEIRISSGSSLGLFAHELKHAYQFEKGQLSIGSLFKNHPRLGKGTLFYDKYDELEAYKRGNLFGVRESYTNINELPSMYNQLNNNVSNIDTVSVKHPGFKRALQTNNVQALQEFSNSLNTAFRVNGRTYYPGQNSSQ